jgi:metal-responsive CopG/Arc/MetJ family transcriptional regulator
LGRKKKQIDPRPRVPTVEDLKENSAKRNVSVRLDSLSLKQIEIISISSNMNRSEIIQAAVSDYAAREKEKKITVELQAKQKAETNQSLDKGAQLERAFMKKLIFDQSAYSSGWNAV